MKKKRNFFVRFFCAIGRGIEKFFLYIAYTILYIIAFPFTRCKVRGKENIKPDDEARVFVCNHYEMYGPIAVFLNFPYKFRPWIIDKMMDKKKIEAQMSIMVYNNYKHFPKWFKKLVIKCVRNLMVFIMHHAKGIPVSHDNLRENIQAIDISTQEFKKNKAIIIWPEKLYQKSGVGEFQTGFSHIAKYTYQKIHKKITFYPMFISQKYKEMYVGEPIVFNPENKSSEEKERIVTYLHDEMVKQYNEFEVARDNLALEQKNAKLQKKLAKKGRKLETIEKITKKEGLTDAQEES